MYLTTFRYQLYADMYLTTFRYQLLQNNMQNNKHTICRYVFDNFQVSIICRYVFDNFQVSIIAEQYADMYLTTFRYQLLQEHFLKYF